MSTPTKILNKLNEFCTSSSFEVNPSKTKFMIFGHNKRKLNQEAFHPNKDQIEITHKRKNLGINFYTHGYFEPPSKRQGIIGLKALMKNLEKEVVDGCTCWELISHLFNALVLPTFMYGTEKWGGHLKKLLLESLHQEGLEGAYNVSSQSAFFDYVSYCAGQIKRTSHKIIHFRAYYGLSTTAIAHLSLLVSR